MPDTQQYSQENLTKHTSKFTRYLRLIIGFVVIAGLIIGGLGTYVLSLPEYSIYQMFEADDQNDYSQMIDFIDFSAISRELISDSNFDLELFGIDQADLEERVSDVISEEIQGEVKLGTFFEDEYRDFFLLLSVG
jgi:hypothetical protein